MLRLTHPFRYLRSRQPHLQPSLSFRFDFDFFLIRLDLGFKLKDPSLDRGEKWFWESKNNYDNYLENLRSKGLTEQESYRYFPNINLGIGYPF